MSEPDAPTTRADPGPSDRGGLPVILVAEDDEHHRFVLKRVFKAIDIEARLHFVTDGQDLLDYLECVGRHAEPGAAPWPDLVLVDLHMPRLDGITALQTMRARRHMRTVPTIVFSSSDRPHHIDSAYASGANAYLVKVGDFKELVGHLRGMATFWLRAARLPRKPGPDALTVPVAGPVAP